MVPETVSPNIKPDLLKTIEAFVHSDQYFTTKSDWPAHLFSLSAGGVNILILNRKEGKTFYFDKMPDLATIRAIGCDCTVNIENSLKRLVAQSNTSFTC